MKREIVVELPDFPEEQGYQFELCQYMPAKIEQSLRQQEQAIDHDPVFLWKEATYLDSSPIGNSQIKFLKGVAELQWSAAQELPAALQDPRDEGYKYAALRIGALMAYRSYTSTSYDRARAIQQLANAEQAMNLIATHHPY